MDSASPAGSSSYQIYPKRWFMLLVSALLNVANAMLWISYASVANTTDEFYCATANHTNHTSTESSCDAANWCSLIFMMASIPFGMLAMWSVDRFGLRPAILLGSWASCIGSVIRIVSSLDLLPISARFPLVLLGQGIAACAQPFIMYIPPKLASLWFPENQRTTANVIGSMSNPLGIMVAMLIAPKILLYPGDMWKLNLYMALPSVLVTVLSSLFVCSSTPPLPPTSSAAKTPPPFLQGLKQVLKDKAVICLVICLGAGVGLFNAVYTLIEQVLCPQGYTNDFAGMCGALLIAGGLVASGIAGVIVDKTKLFQEVMKVAFGLAAVVACGFALVTLHSDIGWAIVLTCVLFGAFGFTVYGIGLEMGVECTYPVAEATSTGLIIISGQIQGIILVLLMSSLGTEITADKDPDAYALQTCSQAASIVKPYNMLVPNLVLAGYGGLSASAFMLLFWPKYRRMLSETEHLNNAALER